MAKVNVIAYIFLGIKFCLQGSFKICIVFIEGPLDIRQLFKLFC